MKKIIYEKQKKPGVIYALAGRMELPVVDITNPAFYTEPDENLIKKLEADYLASEEKTAKIPAFIRGIMIRLVLGSSIIGRGLRAADGSYLSGITTYIMKLGPDNLGKGYSTNVDRAITGSLAGLSLRLRLQDMARFMADALLPLLAENPVSLHFLNIAGGPSMDTLNSLILLKKEHQEILKSRMIKIDILDMDSEGPGFAIKSLAELKKPGAPLAGLDIQARAVKFDWCNVGGLYKYIKENVPSNSVLAVSSEGGIFDYCPDDVLYANMKAIYDAAPPGTILAGTLTNTDNIAAAFNRTSRAKTIPRSIEEFASKAKGAGWELEKSSIRPLSVVVGLSKGRRLEG